MLKTTPQIDPSWLEPLQSAFNDSNFSALKAFLVSEKQAGKIIYPKGSEIFAAFNFTPFNEVKVIILGQDPYHGPGQAHGLCFSVNEGVPFPPSLLNIFKEIQTDCGLSIPKSGNLQRWAIQGVLLLNTILTVEANKAASHQKKGWELFTDAVISVLSEQKEGLIFLLWGKHAQQKANLIDSRKHHLLLAAHPSPLSAYNGFFGCKHFSKTNQILESTNQKPIQW